MLITIPFSFCFRARETHRQQAIGVSIPLISRTFILEYLIDHPFGSRNVVALKSPRCILLFSMESIDSCQLIIYEKITNAARRTLMDGADFSRISFHSRTCLTRPGTNESTRRATPLYRAA